MDSARRHPRRMTRFEEHEVEVPAGLCRRCVRYVSRKVSDVPGVISLQVEAAVGRLRIRGRLDPPLLTAALRSAGFARTDIRFRSGGADSGRGCGG